MKKYTILTLAPVLALLAVGCSSPTAMKSTEYDDMYYSSSDRTEYIQSKAVAATEQGAETYYEEDAGSSNDVLAEGEVANPEYSGNASGLNTYSDDEYYDGRSYDPRDNWYRPNYSYIDPYWGSAYVPRYNRYSPYAYDPYYASAYAYDPFYSDPFWGSPFYGSGLSISIGYSMGWGNSWGHRYPYSSWYPYNNFYNGYYQGFYHGYYAHSPYSYYYDTPIYGGARKLQYGPRQTRGAVVTDGQRTSGGRPERGGVSQDQEQRVVGRSTNRQTRSSQATDATRPTDTQAKDVLPSRPSRNTYYDARGGQGRPTTNDRRQQQQRQQQVQPQQQQQRQTEQPRQQQIRRVPRTNDSPARQSRPQPVQRETRTYESRPARSYESQSSSPSRSYEPSRSNSSSSSSPSSSGGSSSGGGRPPRGH